ncbi:MAG: Cof-type HAD-IIB family hydrolase [Erysipelotrichaceae bacterium]|nr:Cof-type HAD-IIB family hydrolase [Erysipelotrichaceae bacterium]
MSKLYFFDIDGTLIDCTRGIFEIEDGVVKILDQLKSQSDDVFLATGRCKCFIVDGVMKYPFSGYVTCNGAYVEYQGKTIYKKLVSTEALKATHDICVERDMAYYFESNNYIYVLNKNNPKHLEFKEKWGMKDEVIVDDFDINNIETYIGMIVINSKEDEEPMRNALSPYFNIQRHRNEYSFDLTIKGESKAKGIKELVKGLNKDMKDTIAFGDGRNDIEMLEEVELGIAMGNSMVEAKQAAKYITNDIDDDGIMKALQYFSLIQR